MAGYESLLLNSLMYNSLLNERGIRIYSKQLGGVWVGIYIRNSHFKETAPWLGFFQNAFSFLASNLTEQFYLEGLVAQQMGTHC